MSLDSLPSEIIYEIINLVFNTYDSCPLLIRQLRRTSLSQLNHQWKELELDSTEYFINSTRQATLLANILSQERHKARAERCQQLTLLDWRGETKQKVEDEGTTRERIKRVGELVALLPGLRSITIQTPTYFPDNDVITNGEGSALVASLQQLKHVESFTGFGAASFLRYWPQLLHLDLGLNQLDLSSCSFPHLVSLSGLSISTARLPLSYSPLINSAASTLTSLHIRFFIASFSRTEIPSVFLPHLTTLTYDIGRRDTQPEKNHYELDEWIRHSPLLITLKLGDSGYRDFSFLDALPRLKYLTICIGYSPSLIRLNDRLNDLELRLSGESPESDRTERRRRELKAISIQFLERNDYRKFTGHPHGIGIEANKLGIEYKVDVEEGNA